MSDIEDHDDATSWHGIEEEEITTVNVRDHPAVVRLSEILDGGNWTVWRERITRILNMYGINKYINGTVERPKDPRQVKKWDYNNNYGQLMIVNNISASEMLHTSHCENARAMWVSLEAVHESTGPQTVIAIARNLWHMEADETSDIDEHLGKCKKYWEEINRITDRSFCISDGWFKAILATSLPRSWDAFTVHRVLCRH